MIEKKDEKQLLVEKYGLKHENCAWYSEKENAHKHLIFKDAFFAHRYNWSIVSYQQIMYGKGKIFSHKYCTV